MMKMAILETILISQFRQMSNPGHLLRTLRRTPEHHIPVILLIPVICSIWWFDSCDLLDSNCIDYLKHTAIKYASSRNLDPVIFAFHNAY